MQTKAAAAHVNVDQDCLDHVRRALATCTPAHDALRGVNAAESVSGRKRKNKKRWRRSGSSPRPGPASSNSGTDSGVGGSTKSQRT